MLSLDLALFRALNAQASTAPWVIALARGISVQGPLLAAAGLVIALVWGGPLPRRGVAQALGAMAMTWLCVQWLRHGVNAPRPAQLGLGVQWIAHAARAGFPSMHAACAAALAASLTLSGGRWWAAVAWVMALAMAWSRVSLGVHFPSDVLAGMATGCLAAGGVYAALAHLPAQALSWRRRFSAYWSHRALP